MANNHDVDLIKKTFSDSSMAIHFLFLTKTPPPNIDTARMSPSGMIMAEQSEDIYSAFREIKVKVKRGDYAITHRAGYFAN